jgi:Mn2+/Fe2+ NRAMP family transporter
VLVLAALVFPPRGLHADHYSQLALLLQDAFGHWGFVLFVLSLGIACLGAALEITLEMAYFAAQGFGWNWSENQPPKKEARFSLTYIVVILLATVIVLTGVDPLKITIMSMALTAATLPLSIIPFLILMNDRNYLEEHTNGWFSNSVVILIVMLAFVLAVVSIPLQILGGN